MRAFLRVSTRGHYGLVLMVYLAGNFGSGRNVSLKEAGDNENISEKYLEEIAALLKKKKLIQSQRGKSGGYKLAKNPAQIHILDIIEALEGPLALVECLGKTNFLSCDNKKCLSKNIWQKIQKGLYVNLSKMRLGDFI